MNQPDDRKTCSLCNRKFAQDRLAKHIEICKKQKEKKRNVFDSYKQRQILDTSDENAETNKPEKPASQASSKPRTRIVKPVSRPAVKAAKKAPVKADETNEEPKTKATVNGGTTTKTTKSSQTNNGLANGTAKGMSNGLTNGLTNGTSNGTSNGISNGKSNGQTAPGNQSESSSTDDTQGTRKATNGKKSQWRENHEEFVRSMQTAKGSLESSDEPTAAHKSNGIEAADKESTITTNSESTSNTTASSTATINLAAATTNERNHPNDTEERPAGERPKPAPRKIQPPQSRLNKGKSSANPANAPQLTNGKQVNGQRMMNGASATVSGGSSAHSSSSNGTAHNVSTPASTKKSINNSVECPTCGRIFNRAAGERHLPFCAEQQRKSSSNVTNQEALARFRARNAYRSTKGVIRKRDKSVPNEKKENYVRQSSLRRALSTIDGLDQVFNGPPAKEQLNGGNSSSNLRKRSTSQGNLNRSTPKYGQPVKKLQINTSTHSKSSSASSKGSSAPNGNYSSAGYRETAQSRVKARLNQQQRLQKQRMNSNYPKTPIMKFKEKFPNHNNKLIEFADSQQFSQMFKHLNTNSVELNNLPKTVPGVRTGGLSPTKDIHRNGRHIEDLNDLEQLRAKIKEMYLSSNGNHSQGDLINLDYHLAGGEFETSFTRENSSKMKSSKSVNDFLALNDGFNDHLMNDLELPRSCHQCSTEFITSSARYCYSCGARRLGTVNSYLV